MMNSIGITTVGQTGFADLSSTALTGEKSGFGDLLRNAIHGVDQVNSAAATQVGKLLQGGDVDVSEVMMAVEKSDISFQLMMQVRNKIVSAYQEIEKMQF